MKFVEFPNYQNITPEKARQILGFATCHELEILIKEGRVDRRGFFIVDVTDKLVFFIGHVIISELNGWRREAELVYRNGVFFLKKLSWVRSIGTDSRANRKPGRNFSLKFVRWAEKLSDLESFDAYERAAESENDKILASLGIF